MPDSALSSAVFPFEEISAALELVPIAARRALDHAGVRLSLDGWRSLTLDDRRAITLAGVEERVDAPRVVASAARASPLPHAVPPVGDPDPVAPPEALARALDPLRWLDGRTWVRLRALDRYALAHAHRRAVARDDPARLLIAADAILPPQRPAKSAPSTPPSAPLRAAGSSRPPAPRAAVAPSSPPPLEPPPIEPPASTHVNAEGEVHMVDVGAKPSTQRRAVASGYVRMKPETAARIARRDAPKGEVLATARLAGIMAAKRTSELIPLCHAVALTSVEVHLDLDVAAARVGVTAVAEAQDRTGVEMEAMVAVSVACLTIYDMLKGVDRGMVIGEVKLLEKSGGKTGTWRRGAEGA